MKKYLAILSLCLIFWASSLWAVDNDDSHTLWYVSSLKGGGAGSLDGAVSGTSIGPYDMAMVRAPDPNVSGTTRIFFYYVTTITESEDCSTYPCDVIRPDDIGGGVTSWHIFEDFGQPTTGTSPFRVVSQTAQSGASAIYYGSGETITGAHGNTLIYHEGSSWDFIWLPAINDAASGTTFYKIVETASGGGVTVYAGGDGSPGGAGGFVGNGISGNSVFVLESGNQWHSATFYSHDSGGSKYFFVEASSAWETKGD